MLSFDELLDKVGGGANRYQIGVVSCICLCNFISCMMTISPVFTAASQQYRCLINNHSLARHSTTYGDLLNVTHHKCSVSFRIQHNAHPAGPYASGGSMSPPHEHIYHLTNCDEYEFSREEFQSTIRSQYGLVCDKEYLSHLSSTIFFIGFMTGSVMFGGLADLLGRLFAFNGSIATCSLASILALFSPSFLVYGIARLFVGMGIGGVLVTGYILGSEYVDKDHRLLWAVIMHNAWSLGGSVFSLVAYFVRSHVTLQIIYIVPSVFLLLMNFYVYESPRWLYATGRLHRCEKVLRIVAKWNQRPVPPSITALKNDVAVELEEESENKKPTTRGNVLDLVRPSGMRRVTITSWFLWFTCSLVYYGLLFVMQDVGGNIYVNTALGMLIELPSRFFIILVDRKYGRRVLIVGSLAVGAFTLSTCGILKRVSLTYTVHPAVLVVLVLIGRFGMVFAFDMAWLSSSEVFPTVIRNIGVGSSSMWARIAGTLAPQIGALDKLWKASPLFLLAGLPLLSLVLVIRYLPETRGITVPETIEEGELLAWGKWPPESKKSDEDDASLSTLPTHF